MLEHGGQRAAVLALQAVEQREALLDLVEAAGRRLHALAVAAQVGGEVVGLDGERGHAVGQRVELAVHPANALQCPGGARQRTGGAVALLAGQRVERHAAAAPISASR